MSRFTNDPGFPFTKIDKDYVMGSAGSKFCGLKVRPKDLVEALNVIVIDIARLN